MRASFLILFFLAIFGLFFAPQARLDTQVYPSGVIKVSSTKNEEASHQTKSKKGFLSGLRGSIRKKKQPPKKQTSAQTKGALNVVTKERDVLVHSSKDTSTLVCHIDLEGITNTTQHPIDYNRCRLDLTYALNQLVQGYYFVQACPVYKNRAGDKRRVLGALARCLDKHKDYYTPESESVRRRLEQLQLFVPITSVFKVLSEYFESQAPQETPLIHTYGDRNIIPFNIERFLKEIINLEPKYLDSDRLEVDANHQAEMILRLLFNTLVTPKNLPHIHTLMCNDELIWHFNEKLLKKNGPIKALRVVSTGLAKTQNACSDKKLLFNKLIPLIEGKNFEDVPKHLRDSITFLKTKVRNGRGYTFNQFEKKEYLEKIKNMETYLEAYERLDETVGFKTYILGVLRAYAHGKTSLSLANKQGFKKSANAKGKIQRQAYQLSVSNVTKLYNALAETAQNKNTNDFVASWIQALGQHLSADILPTLPDELQEQLSATDKRLQSQNIFHCRVAERKGSGEVSIVFDRKACQADPIYALSAFYRLEQFRNVCARNTDFDGFHPTQEAKTCLLSALQLMSQPGFEKTPAYEQLKPAIKAIQEQVSYKEYFKSIQEGLAKSAGKKGFSVSSVTHFPRKQFGRWEGMSTIKFAPLDLVKGVSGYLKRSLQETQALSKQVKKPHSRREAMKTLEGQEQEEALALLSVLAQKAQEAHSELIQCPESKDRVFFNRFACTANEEQTFAGLYDVLRITKHCPKELLLLRNRVLAKCLTYFKDGKEAKKQALFASFPQDRVAALEKSISLSVFLEKLQRAFNKLDDVFTVPLKLTEKGNPLTITCSIKELQLRFDAASRNKKINSQPPALIAFGVIERYLNQKIRQSINAGAH